MLLLFSLYSKIFFNEQIDLSITVVQMKSYDWTTSNPILANVWVFPLGKHGVNDCHQIARQGTRESWGTLLQKPKLLPTPARPSLHQGVPTIASLSSCLGTLSKSFGMHSCWHDTLRSFIRHTFAGEGICRLSSYTVQNVELPLQIP